MKIGNNANKAVRYVSSDPDGVLTAQRGTLAINTTTGAVFQNTNGGTEWKALVQMVMRWVSGRYYFMPPITQGPSTNNGLGVGTLRAIPFYLPNAITASRIGAEITTVGEAGSKLRLGIYADDGTGRPGNLVVDAGTINGDSATVQELTVSTALSPGQYWAAAAVQVVAVTQPTIRTCGASVNVVTDAGTTMPVAAWQQAGWSVTGVTGALPGTFGPTAAISGANIPRLFLKVA